MALKQESLEFVNRLCLTEDFFNGRVDPRPIPAPEADYIDLLKKVEKEAEKPKMIASRLKNQVKRLKIKRGGVL